MRGDHRRDDHGTPLHLLNTISAAHVAHEDDDPGARLAPMWIHDVRLSCASLLLSATAMTPGVATFGLSGYACEASVSDYPRKTKIARLSPSSSSGFNFPIRVPSRCRGTAVSLSTITLHGARSPVRVFAGIGSLKVGAGVGSVVKGHTTIESFASNRSS